MSSQRASAMGILFSSKPVQGSEVDFENAKPSETEKQIYDEVDRVLQSKAEVLQLIENYKGCQDLARAAMATPSPETEKAAFEGLLGAVDSISRFFQYSKSLEQIFPRLLKKLGEGIQGNVVKLEAKQALARQLGEIFDFALNFDRVRMLRPNLSNDFSYYRRLLPKFNKHPQIRVKDDEASGMALFTAEHIPMTAALSKAGAKAQSESDSVSAVLSSMANSCMLILKKNAFQRPETGIFVARAMTGAIVVFDHVDALGAFSKRGPIAIKQCINVLKKDFPKETSLLNAIRYSTKSFREAPDDIQKLFD